MPLNNSKLKQWTSHLTRDTIVYDLFIIMGIETQGI